MAQNNTAAKKHYKHTIVGQAGEWQIHRAGCAHIRKIRSDKHHIGVNSAHGAESAAKAVRNWWLDPEMKELGWNEAHVKIMDCAKKEIG